MARAFIQNRSCLFTLFCELTCCLFWKKANCICAYANTAGEEIRNLDSFLAWSLFPMRLALWLLLSGFRFNQNTEVPGSFWPSPRSSQSREWKRQRQNVKPETGSEMTGARGVASGGACLSLVQHRGGQTMAHRPNHSHCVLLEHGHAHSFTCYLQRHSCCNGLKLSSCDRDRKAQKAKNIYYLAFYIKSFLTPDLDDADQGNTNFYN